MIEESLQLNGGAESTTEFQYDRAGNRTRSIEANGDVTQYIYDANDQLTQVNLPNQIHFEKYEYDARGNLEEVSLWAHGVPAHEIAGTTTSYTYNAKNQLTQVALPNMGNINYEYNYRGDRTFQEYLGITAPTHYLWDEFSQFGDVVLEIGVNPDSSLYRSMDYTLAGGMLVSQTDVSGLTRYFLSDAQGTTRSVTDDAGAVTSNFTYDAFGELDADIDPLTTETNYLYAGQQFDPYTELYSMRARYYDPTVGRFQTRDTWAYNYANPFELNRYVYTSNNPVTYTDPSGYLTEVFGAYRPAADNSTSLATIGLWTTTGLAFTCYFLSPVCKDYVDDRVPDFSNRGNSRGTNPSQGGNSGGSGTDFLDDVINVGNKLKDAYNTWRGLEQLSDLINYFSQANDNAVAIAEAEEAVAEEESEEWVRVRHYSRRIEQIRSSMVLKVNPDRGPFIFVEFPIETGFGADEIQTTTRGFYRALDGSGGFVEFNVNREWLDEDTNTDAPNARKIVIQRVVGNNLEQLMVILNQGLSLADPRMNPIFYNWEENLLGG